MGRKAGVLLWNRQHVKIEGAIPGEPDVPVPTDINTQLVQQNTGFDNYSPDEPRLGPSIAPPGPGPFAGGTPPVSRVQVIPMAPLALWVDVTHSEPYVDPATGEVHVTFQKSTKGNVTLNVLFWDPHSMIGPGDADFYNPLPDPPRPIF